MSSDPCVGKSSSNGRVLDRSRSWRREGADSGPSGEASGEASRESSSRGSGTEAGRKEQVGQHIFLYLWAGEMAPGVQGLSVPHTNILGCWRLED